MDVGTATLIGDVDGGWPGPAKRYRLNPPLDGHAEVVVFTAKAFGQKETVVTPVSGASLKRLRGSVTGYTEHAYALFVAGYALIEEEGNDG